jgi:hypothetical protein
MSIDTTVKVAIVFYCLGFAACVLATTVACGRLASVPMIERRVAAAVAVALPFIGVRLAYSALAVFLNNDTFALGDGSVVLYVVMAVVEEYIVVAIYLLVGFRVDKLDIAAQGELLSRPWKRNKNEGPRMQRG